MTDRINDMAQYLIREGHLDPAGAQDAAVGVIAAVDELRHQEIPQSRVE